MAEQLPTVSIIIVNWNGAHHLPTCLDSLAVQTIRDFEVLVVDNGSTDGSLVLLADRYPWVRTLALPDNCGFAAGNNRGFAAARGRYLVTLNNDTRVDSDWLEQLVAVADAHPEAGMVGCRICAFDDPDLIDSLGMAICADGMARGRHRLKRWSALSVGEVEEILFPSACAALYRRELIDETGGFDEDFFAYAEDSDLGLRGRLAGWGALLASRAVVGHKYSQTAGSFSPLKLYLVERNHYWVALKCFPASLLAMLPFFTLIRYIQQMKMVCSGRGSGGEFRASGSPAGLILAVLRGTLAALAGTPRMLARRRQVMGRRRLGRGEFLALLRRHQIDFAELLDGN